MGSAHEPCQRSPTDGAERLPGHSRGISRGSSSRAEGGRAAEIIASSPERQKLEMQVQIHRSAQQCNEALAISRHLADAPHESWEPATWVGLVRRELAELDERLSRQLVRLQSQTDRVMEVFVTSLEGKVAHVMSKQPLTEWRLAELGANIKGLQEQLEMQARRGDAADARLQRFSASFQSELKKVQHIEVPSEEKLSPSGLEGTDALKDAMLASLREDEAPGAVASTHALQEIKSKMAKIESQMLHKMDRSLETVRSSSAVEHRTVKSELETLRQQVLKLEEAREAKAQEAHFVTVEEKVGQLENATDSFMSLLMTTNQHLDAVVVKQASLEEDFRRLALSSSEPQGSSSSASRAELSLQESVEREVKNCLGEGRGRFDQSWEKRLRREHRLEAAALWKAIGELAEHIGADGADFIQVAQHSSAGIKDVERQLEVPEHKEVSERGQSKPLQEA